MNNNENKLIGIRSHLVREEVSVERGEYEGKTYYQVMEGNTLKLQFGTEEEATEAAKLLVDNTASAEQKMTVWTQFRNLPAHIKRI